MYLTERRTLASSNGITLIAWKEGTIERIGMDCQWVEEPADYALGWDSITKEYKCYARPESNNGPGFASSNYDSASEVELRRALKALAYGNTVQSGKMFEVFSDV